MAEKQSLTPEQLAKLLAILSAKTGVGPEALLALLRSGDLAKALSLFGAGGGRAQELFASGRIDELLETPAAQEILARLLQ